MIEIHHGTWYSSRKRPACWRGVTPANLEMKDIDFFLRLESDETGTDVRACWLINHISDDKGRIAASVRMSPGQIGDGPETASTNWILVPRHENVDVEAMRNKIVHVYVMPDESGNDGVSCRHCVAWATTFPTLAMAEDSNAEFMPQLNTHKLGCSSHQNPPPNNWNSVVTCFRNGTINISSIESYCDNCLLNSTIDPKKVVWIYTELNFRKFLKNLVSMSSEVDLNDD